MLRFDRLDADDRFELQDRLRRKLADYIQWREKSAFDETQFKDSRDWRLGELIPYDWIRRGTDLQACGPFVEPRGWHVQIYYQRRPRYYVRTLEKPSGWVVEWIGEEWLARQINSGMLWLEEQEDQLPDSNVRLLSSRLYEFSSFWLPRTRQHVVVSASWRLRRVLPLHRWLAEGELAEYLLAHFGKQRGQGGIVRG